MKVLVVEPDYAPYEKEINGLPEMRATVGGTIQAIYPFEEQVAVICNDDGISMGLPFNRSMGGKNGVVFGTFFVCGLGEENFISLTPEQMKHYKQRFHHAEILMKAKGNEAFTIKVPPKHRGQPDQPPRAPKPPER